MIHNYSIREKFVKMVKRYENENDLKTKIQMKYKFIDWLKLYQDELTDAEIEYLQACICKVNLMD